MSPNRPPTSGGALMIAPGGYGDGPSVRLHAQAAGQTVIGASSVQDDPASADYDRWVFLPHVSDAGFDEAVADLVGRLGLARIHATHYIVWTHLKRVLDRTAPDVVLTLGRSYFDLEADYRDLAARTAEPLAIAGMPASSPREPLSPVETAGFLRATLSVPGESYEPKLRAIMEIARRTPRGDLVEIGSLFGRTAVLLALLARRYDLGAVLCVDPWSRDTNDQGAAALLQPSLAYDWQAWRRIFEINVAPFAFGRLNYIQSTGASGGQVYAAGRRIVTDVFGAVDYEGRIGLLHIDGNHRYEHVLADTETWSPFVKPGGWIVFDDYEWDWGDGPRRVADAFIARRPPQARFVVGGALFVQLAD